MAGKPRDEADITSLTCPWLEWWVKAPLESKWDHQAKQWLLGCISLARVCRLKSLGWWPHASSAPVPSSLPELPGHPMELPQAGRANREAQEQGTLGQGSSREQAIGPEDRRVGTIPVNLREGVGTVCEWAEPPLIKPRLANDKGQWALGGWLVQTLSQPVIQRSPQGSRNRVEQSPPSDSDPLRPTFKELVCSPTLSTHIQWKSLLLGAHGARFSGWWNKEHWLPSTWEVYHSAVMTSSCYLISTFSLPGEQLAGADHS